MAHETFYNSLLIAMGNVVSALLMYALQAAWLCQRLIDQDYRQNHGSRLKPIIDSKTLSEPVEITIPNPQRHHGDFPKRQNENKKRKHGHNHHHHQQQQQQQSGRPRTRTTNIIERGYNWSHPYLENSDSLTTTVEYVKRLGTNVGLRRAFSDINLSSGCSEFRNFDTNQNYVEGEDNSKTHSMADEDFVRLVYSKGYVT